MAKRILLIAAAVIVAGLIVTGIVVAVSNSGLFKGDSSNSSNTSQTESSADNSPVDRSSDAPEGEAPAATDGSSTTTQTPDQAAATIPSTGPSETITVLLTAVILAGATYGGTRLVQVTVRK